MKILSHRGNGFDAPENTMTAFKSAVKSDNNHGLEIDVQLTKDGFIVIHHDDQLGRVFQGNESFAQLTLEEVQERPCLVEGYEKSRIPLLSDLLRLMMNTGKFINIELKIAEDADDKKLVERVLALVDQYGIKEQIIYSSFHEESIQYLKKLLPEANSNLLLEHGDAHETRLLDIIKRPHIDGLHLSIESWRIFDDNLRNELMGQTKTRLWTVNDSYDFESIFNDNLDAIITDKSNLARLKFNSF